MTYEKMYIKIVPFFILLFINFNLNASSASKYQIPSTHNNQQNHTSSYIITTLSDNERIIDIDDFIKKDLLKKYENYEKSVKNALISETGKNLTLKAKLIEDACEMHLWTQNQEYQNGYDTMPLVLLPNNIIDNQNKTILAQLDVNNSMLAINAYLANLRNKYTVDYKIEQLHLNKNT